MIRVYCDFDGTVSGRDIGDALFRTFAGKRATEIVRRYLDGDLNSRECLRQECEAVGHATPALLEAFLEDKQLDSAFPDFVRFCAEREVPLVVLSDGLDFYVKRVLERYGLGHLKWFANHVEFVPDGDRTRLVPSFPYRDAECELCANCKRNHILTLSGDNDIIVYVGDGISDRCPVRYADVVFAKKGLIKYCQQQNVSYHEYSTFADVQRRLEELMHRKRLKKRQTAERARREVFLQG